MAYIYDDCLLMHRWTNDVSKDVDCATKVVVPIVCHSQVLSLVHDYP